MKFYKYWAQAEATVQSGNRPWKLRAYGGSNQGMDEARQRARETAERAAAAIQQGPLASTYGYADRPLREEIVQEINGASGFAGVITRNSLGSLILNTARVMFVDVDYPAQEGSLVAGLRGLWGSLRGKPPAPRPDRDQPILQRFENVSRARPDLGFRVYRTAGGFRLLVTSQTFEPASADTMELLAEFGSDPLYVRLCKSQECFRARLSAKFWRCSASRPPSRFPWSDAAKEQEYRAWEQKYHAAANRFAVCELVGHRGETAVDENVQPILETHDRLTMQEGAKLA
jgi:hypothetical protein